MDQNIAIGVRAITFPSWRLPRIVGLDGRSGAGKSTLARALADATGAKLLDGDSFFAGGTAIRTEAAAQRADLCIDRTRQIAVLERLRALKPARYRPFDWDSFDGSLAAVPVKVPAAALIILEGVYACHPDLHHLLDLKILLRTPEAERLSRLHSREREIGAWERQWHEAEDWYFTTLMPDHRFDLVLDG